MLTMEKGVSEWRKIEQERQRDAARIELENMENTAGLEQNLEAVKEVEGHLSPSDLYGSVIPIIEDFQQLLELKLKIQHCTLTEQ
ncbi:hypothetical protein O6P43_013752 [Quillaja saponaria]|uniref:Uncharacterized protein n=1 Tax=Quillaja saponaria TaxID=32244 RepID=A0AAD7LT60_QUISA|nr:hypothetical protein O6P43_013752 [Quillaja saponaria]